MKQPPLVCALILLATPVSIFAAGTVTVDLSSLEDGSTVPAGTPIDWTITATVSTGDNVGLAMISADLFQDAANPELLDLAPATGVPVGLEGFSRPDGLSNPGPGGVGSGYGGTATGPAGQQDITQIGGSQNTFGAPGAVMGIDTVVDPGVGQSPGGQVIATGSFNAPLTPGTYNFSLKTVLANTLDVVNSAPAFSPASSAVIDTSAASFSFTVCLAGDADADQALTLADVPFFVDLLLGNTTPDANGQCAADLNGDGEINGGDIQGFVDKLIQAVTRSEP